MIEIYYLEIDVERHWTWHAMLFELINYYKKNYDVNLIYKTGGGFLYAERFETYLSDCEILIYDVEKDILKGILFCECRRESFDIFAKRNNPNDLMLMTHQYGLFSNKEAWPPHNFKKCGTVYYPLVPYIDHNYYYTLRKFRGNQNLIDQMFCLFSTNRHDPHQLREMGLVSPSQGPLDINKYLKMAIEYKIGLSIAGIGEVCHRDFEYMAIGLPMLRIEYLNNTLMPPLIPNYHYISIDRAKYNLPYDARLDREGGPQYIQAYVERFFEVKDDSNFLNFIAENAKKYFEEYCSPQNRLKHILNLLNNN